MADNMQVERFNRKMQRAMDRVKVVLHAERVPQFASEVHHQYEDKYLLAERITNAACASQLNCLRAVGLTGEQLATLRAWCAGGSAVSLRFRAEQYCSFLREATREEESKKASVEEVRNVTGALQAAFKSKVVTTITEFFWKLSSSYEIVAIRGVGQEPGDRLVVASRAGEVELMTSTKSPPHPEARVPAAQCEVNITWLLKQLPGDGTCFRFQIDRASDKCNTPRRNPGVDAGFEHFVGFANWAKDVFGFMDSLLHIQPDQTKKLDLGGLQSSSVFAPLLPLMTDVDGVDRSQPSATPHPAVVANGAPAAEATAQNAEMRGWGDGMEDDETERRTQRKNWESDWDAGGALVAIDTTPCGSCAVLGAVDMNRLLAEESRSLCERIEEVRQGFPNGGTVATAAEAVLVVILRHCAQVCEQWSDVLDYIEGMIRQQLVAAIGKEVTPADFADYMQFHSRKLFARPYAPAPFCYAVRRSDRHSPEGTLSIEEMKAGSGSFPFGGDMALPVVTLAALSTRDTAECPMEFPINASTSIRFGGDVHLHAYLSHQFSGESGSSLNLVSRARQFSSFLVLVGRIASVNMFEPKYAAIVQNKDELAIPLDLSTIPTPKEFKDAIESLSPEQQRFAQAFRAMQLESTLFGILVIQIKPQLEKVLNLPPDSLTKEIKLTQDLMQLFIKYQIPSDLLSFDAKDTETGAEIVGAGSQEKLEAVKQHVKAMYDMIDDAKKGEIEEAKRQAEFEQPLPRPAGVGIMGGSMDGMTLGAAPESSFGGGFNFGGGMQLQSQQMASQVSRSAKGAIKKKASTGGGLFGGSAAAAPQMMMACSAPPPPCPAGASMAVSAPPIQPMMARQGAPQGGSLFGSTAAQPAQQTRQQQTQQRLDTPRQQDSPLDASLQPGVRDYTKVPKELDQKFEALDTDSALRPTIVSPGDVWTKRAQKALLAGSPTDTMLFDDDKKREKDAAFDLLDALTKSGALPVENASLHVVVAATHCFDSTVTDTVVKGSVNPIEKVERSLLIMASTVHQKPVAALIQDSQRGRVADTSPGLFLQDGAAESSAAATE